MAATCTTRFGSEAARWSQARENFKRTMDIAEQLKNKKQWEDSLVHQAHLEYYLGNFAASKDLYETASTSALARGDKKILNGCNAGIAAVLLATNDIAGAIGILKNTNSYGQYALALLRSGKREEALEKAMMGKDRFKGKKTKYYVLKAFSSTAEVILKLLELARHSEKRRQRAERAGGAGPSCASSCAGSGGGTCTYSPSTGTPPTSAPAITTATICSGCGGAPPPAVS